MLRYIRRSDNTGFSINIEPKDTVYEIKKKIEEQEGIPIDQQLLYNERTYQLNDDLTFEELAANNFVSLRLVLGMQIYYKLAQLPYTVPIEVRPNELIEDVKKTIEEKSGISWDKQRLIAKGHELEDDKTLQYYQIVNNDSVWVAEDKREKN